MKKPATSCCLGHHNNRSRFEGLPQPDSSCEYAELLRYEGQSTVKCQEVVRQLSEYLDGELEADLVQSLEQHLSRCHDCRIIVDTTRKTIEIFCNSEPLPLPAPVHDRLMKSLAAKLSHPL